MDNYNYPVGADTKDAPWNQADPEEKEIEVLVSLVLSKSFKIKVSDYEIRESGKDEDGQYYEDIDYSCCDLISAVKNQLILPNEVGQILKEVDEHPIDLSLKLNNIIEDLSGWTTDDIEVVIE